MSKINYIDILKKAWSNTWSNKYLWWFGFFIALTGSGNSFNYLTNRGGNADQINQQFSDFAALHGGLVAIGAFIGLIIFILLLIMRILSRGALIGSIEKNSKGQASSFRAGLQDGKKYFWRIFWISFLVPMIVFIIALLIATPIVFLFMTKSYILGSLLTIAGIIIILPLFVLAFFLENYGFIYAVLGDLSLVDALEKAYELFRKNIGASVVMALIFIPIAIVLGLGALFLLFFLGIIFLVIGVIFFLILNKLGAAIILILAILTFLLIFLGVRSIYETFAQTVWIFFFHEIAAPKVEEKVAETEKETVPKINPETTPDAA